MPTISGTNNSYIDEIIGFGIIALIFVLLRSVIFINFELWVVIFILLVGMVIAGILSAVAAIVLKLEVFEIDYQKDTTEIDLSNRAIQTIDLEELGELYELEVLNLEDNQLTKINFAPFRKHPSFQELDISSNRIEVVDLTILKTCVNLRRLDLRDNPIEALEAADLLPLTSFEELLIDEQTILTVEGVELSQDQFHEMESSGISDIDEFMEDQE